MTRYWRMSRWRWNLRNPSLKWCAMYPAPRYPTTRQGPLTRSSNYPKMARQVCAHNILHNTNALPKLFSTVTLSALVHITGPWKFGRINVLASHNATKPLCFRWQPLSQIVSNYWVRLIMIRSPESRIQWAELLLGVAYFPFLSGRYHF